MRPLRDLLEEHLAADFPTEIEKSEFYGSIDPVMIGADIFGWVSSYASGSPLDDVARAGLEQARLDLGESMSALPTSTRPYYALLLRVADTAIQGCDAVPSPQPPLPRGLDLIARVACNGEAMWARSHADAALEALSSAGFEILGLDLRKYPPGGGTYEAPWSSLDADDMTSNLNAARESLKAALESELVEYPWVLITYRNATRSDAGLLESDLTNGEIELLIDGLTDDISFDMALIHFGIRGNPPDRNEPPGRNQIEAAFRSYERLINSGLVRLGRIQYIDAGLPGRVAPVEHVEEPFRDVRGRVDDACRTATEWGDWAFSCWTVNTEAGDAVANRELERR
jgi:hypothetical protein